MSSILRRVLRVLSIMIIAGWNLAGADPCCSALSADEVASRLTIANRLRAGGMSGYEAIRTYVLDNARLGQHAEMIVRVTVRYPDAKQFQLLSVSGPDWMRGALRRILDGEEGRASGHGNDRFRIVSGNYHFRNAKLIAFSGRDTYVLEIEPKTKNPSMLRGRLWIDAQDFAVVRFEGQTAGRVSFWAGTPLVTQTFKKLGSAWVPETNYSVAHSLVFGKTELTVTFSDHVLLGPDRAGVASDIR